MIKCLSARSKFWFRIKRYLLRILFEVLILNLSNNFKPTEQKLSTEVVYKTKEGKIIPKENIKLDGNQDEEIFFPDKKLKLVKKSKNEQLSSPKTSNENTFAKTRGQSNDFKTFPERYVWYE